MSRNYSGVGGSQRTYVDNRPIKGHGPGSIPKEMVDSEMSTFKAANERKLWTNDPEVAARCENIQTGILSGMQFWEKDPAAEERLIKLHRESERVQHESSVKMKLACIRDMKKKKEITEAEFKALLADLK